MQSPLSRLRDAQVRQFLLEHLVLSRGLEYVNRSLRRRPGFSTILTGSPLCSTASQNLRLVASLMKRSFRMAVTFSSSFPPIFDRLNNSVWISVVEE